jgi:NTP pyrophosphatase (non-canonical NTP hydrolase)
VNFKAYTKGVETTENKDFSSMSQRLQEESTVRLLHGAVGLSTESAEILDAMKKHIFYGKPLDKVNLVEELSDQFWYIAIMLSELGVDLDTVLEKNLAKLKSRYGSKFTEASALERNLEAERSILEE